MIDQLQVADYRRQMAEVYVDVRRHLQAGDSQAGWAAWRTGRDALFATHPQSPWAGRPSGERQQIPVFDYDPAWRHEAEVQPTSATHQIGLPHSGAGVTMAHPIGTVVVADHQLVLYWLDQYGGGLFLPFRDATNGPASPTRDGRTYGGGRYLLDSAKSADLGSHDGVLVLDFNFAYHPSCAHDPAWSCPLAPPDNHLSVPVTAGECLPPADPPARDQTLGPTD